MRFFAEHGRCGHGFDLRHPGGPGSGNLRARCRGCGAEVSYSAEDEKEDRVPVVPDVPHASRGDAGGAFRNRVPGAKRLPSRPSLPTVPVPTPSLPSIPGVSRFSRKDHHEGQEDAPPPREAVAAAPPPRERRRTGLRPPLVTAGITCLAVASATFAAVRLSNESSTVPTSGPGSGLGAGAVATVATAPTKTAPTPTVDTPDVTPTPAPAPSPSPTPQPSQKSKKDKHDSRRTSLVSGGPSVDLPGDWERAIDDQAIVLRPKGSGSDRVRVSVYFQRGASITDREMRQQTKRLIKGDKPRAAITTEGPLVTRAGGTSIVATDSKGFERAQGFVDRGTAVVVVVTAEKSANLRLQGEAISVASSVRAP